MVDLRDFSRHSDWAGARVLVLGFDEAGAAATDNLLFLGAQVTTRAEHLDGADAERIDLLRTLGADIAVHQGALDLDDHDLVVVAGPSALAENVVAQARARDLPVWGEVELAWRLRDTDQPAVPWLALTGTRGTAGATRMLVAMLAAEGLTVRVAGPSGVPFVEAVMDPEACDVVVAELSRHQLGAVDSMSARAAVVLDTRGPDAEPRSPIDPLTDPLGRIYQHVELACVYNLADESTTRLVEEADVLDGARAVGFTLGMPSISMMGVVDDILVDRAFITERQSSAAELCTLTDLPSQEPDVVADALAAAALARAHGVSRGSVRDGLRSLRPEA